MFKLFFVVLPILAICLPLLKAMDLIDIKWSVAFLPVIIPAVLFLVFAFVIFTVLLIGSLL